MSEVGALIMNYAKLCSFVRVLDAKLPQMEGRPGRVELEAVGHNCLEVVSHLTYVEL